MTRICFHKVPLALAVALAFSPPAQAQDRPAAPVQIDIAAQPLAQALNELARQTRLELIVPPALAANKTAPPVAGRLTPRQAFGSLLAGTGLSARFEGNTAVIAAAPPVSAGDAALPAVTVSADRDQGVDGSDGYVARRAASGTKSDTAIVETPQSISVVTRQQLEDQRPRSIPEALNYAPGVFTGLVGASNRYDYVSLRGFTDSSVDNVVLDGLRLLNDQGTYLSMQVDPFFLDRIDVIRGPASVLYGRASPGGLVALSSRKPQYEPQGEVQLTLGNFNRRDLGVDLTGPLDSNGVAAFRLSALTRKMDSQVDHVQEERQALFGSLAFKLSPRTNLLLQAYLQHDPEGSYHGGTPYDASVTTARNGRRMSRSFFDGEPDTEKFERNQRFLGYQFEHAFNDGLTFRQNLRHVKADDELAQVYQVGWAGPDTLNRGFSGADESTSGYTMDNQLEARFRSGAIDHTVLAGVDYQKRHVDGSWSWGSANPINAYDPVYGAANLTIDGGYAIDRYLRQTGLYLQDQLALGNWRLTLGGRQDRVKAAFGTADEEPSRWSGNKFTKRIGAVYLLDNGLAPYAAYSDGFNPSLRSNQQGDLIEPTEAEQAEVGIRYQPKGSKTLLAASVYRLEQENIATMPVGALYYVPAGKVRSRGVELEARTELSPSLSLVAAYNYTDIEFLESPAGYKGNTPNQVPKHSASVWGDWRFMPGYTLGAGVRHVGKSWADNDNTVRVSSYTLADLMLRIDLAAFNPSWKGADIRLAANNLFDKRYVASCYSLTTCYWGDARNMTATLSYKW